MPDHEIEISENKKQSANYIAQAWLVILLSFVFGAALTGIQVSLSPLIEKNKMMETFSQIPKLVPGSETGEQVEIAGMTVYRAMSPSGQVGWVIPAKGQGFADKLEILIGLDSSAEKITGLYVLDQKETPGLGNKIIEEIWRSQYKDKSTSDPIEVIKNGTPTGNQIVAVTGATISSAAVTDIVNKTVSALKAQLASNVK
jgi:electron transport complex protein RnfG